MAEYKTPVSRKALKAKIKAAFVLWLDEAITNDDAPDTGMYDEADDAAARQYQDEIEEDKTHTQAMAAARLAFYESIQADLYDYIGTAFDDLNK